MTPPRFPSAARGNPAPEPLPPLRAVGDPCGSSGENVSGYTDRAPDGRYLREVDGLGDDPERCRECGERIINRGAHAERCVGPRAHGVCECPPGWRHLPGCPEVVGYPDEAA